MKELTSAERFSGRVERYYLTIIICKIKTRSYRKFLAINLNYKLINKLILINCLNLQPCFNHCYSDGLNIYVCVCVYKYKCCSVIVGTGIRCDD